MRTFGVIFAVFCLAFSTSAAAIFGRGIVDANGVVTTAEKAVKAKARGFDARDTLSGSTGQVHRRESAIEVISQRNGEDSFPAIVADVTVKVKALAVKLDVAIKADIKVDAVVDILVEIGDVLLSAVVDIRGLVDAKVLGILTLDGKLLAVTDIAVLVAALVNVCVTAIAAVLRIKVLADVDIVVQACMHISVQVGAIITLGVGLIAGLAVEIVALVGGIVADIHLDVCVAIALALGI